jgi:exonuclease SbcC
MKRIQGALDMLQIEEARKTLAMAQEATTKTEETRKRMEEAARELVLLQDQVKAVGGQLDAFVRDAYEDAQKKLEDARKEYGEAQKAVASLGAQLQSMDTRIAELTAMEKDLAERKAALEKMEGEAAQWRRLEGACGPDGIQTLELDAMAPGISETANTLLRAAYGPRFSIEVRTTRNAGKGGRAHQVEDFAIMVLDADCPEIPETELSNMSGGEGVWIARAIADAFAIIRERNHGVRFLSVIQDEGDSALDDDPRTNARQRYFDMLEGGHAESGRVHTIVITHSEVAQQRIPQKIRMRELASEKVEAVA